MFKYSEMNFNSFFFLKINERIENGDHNNESTIFTIFLFFEFCGVVQNHP